MTGIPYNLYSFGVLLMADIGTKNRKNSHPKRKIFQKILRAAKKQLSRGECSVISSARGGTQAIFPPPFLTNETEKGRGAICPRP